MEGVPHSWGRAEGRVRVDARVSLVRLGYPHPVLRTTFSRWEKESAPCRQTRANQVKTALADILLPEANMATALVRDLDDAVYERLKARATGNNRSLEDELREILVLASKQVDVATARAAADAMRRRLEGRPHSDSGELLAEDRLR